MYCITPLILYIAVCLSIPWAVCSGRRAYPLKYCPLPTNLWSCKLKGHMEVWPSWDWQRTKQWDLAHAVKARVAGWVMITLPKTLPRLTIQTFQQHTAAFVSDWFQSLTKAAVVLLECLNYLLIDLTSVFGEVIMTCYTHALDLDTHALDLETHALDLDTHTFNLVHTYSMYWWGEWTYVRTNLCKPINQFLSKIVK